MDPKGCPVCGESCQKIIKCSFKECKSYICKKCIKEWIIDNKSTEGKLRCACGQFGFDINKDMHLVKIYRKCTISNKKEQDWLKYQLKRYFDWDDEFIRIAIKEYIKFLILKIGIKDGYDDIFAPSLVIDKIWLIHTSDKSMYPWNNITRRSITPEYETIHNEKYSTTYSFLSNKSIKLENIWTIPDKIFSMPQIFIKTLTGSTATIHMNLDEDIMLSKYRIYLKTGTPVTYMRIIFSGQQMDRGSLKDYKVQRESTIHLVLKLCGD